MRRSVLGLFVIFVKNIRVKKGLLLLLLLLLTVRCSDNIVFGSPALRAHKDYELWVAHKFTAKVDAQGALTLTGKRAIDSIVLTIPSVDLGTYELTNTSAATAAYFNVEAVYSAKHEGDYNINVYPNFGEIVIQSITDNGITGTFRFVGFSQDGSTTVGFSNGIFYQVPLQ